MIRVSGDSGRDRIICPSLTLPNHVPGRSLRRVREPSPWRYVRAKELKAAGMDWTEVLAAEAESRRARLAIELLAIAAYGSTAERVQAFVETGGGCRATFFSHLLIQRTSPPTTTQGVAWRVRCKPQALLRCGHG